jgi:hypothetical protein
MAHIDAIPMKVRRRKTREKKNKVDVAKRFVKYPFLVRFLEWLT